MSRSRVGLIVAIVVVLAIAVVVGLARRGGDGGNSTAPHSSSTSPDGAHTPLQKEAEAVTAALLAPGDGAPAVASAQGSVDTFSDSGRMQPAVAEILAVEVRPSGTLLRWRLKSTGGSLKLRPTTFSSSGNPSVTASEVALVSPTAKEEGKPFRFRSGSFGISCVCSIVPNEVNGTGQELSALYPPFSQEPTQVEVRIPGFPPISGVPVTRG